MAKIKAVALAVGLRFLLQGCRSRGAGRAVAPEILADQLTLPQPGPGGLGADYAHHITTCPIPRICRPSYGPVLSNLMNEEK